MSELDIAREVEEADLPTMRDMNIADVYTLMDVQLRERPGPRDLYKRWERQNWSAYSIDFTKDAEDWQTIPDIFKDELLFGFVAFYLGEQAVTDTLSPLVHAAPTEEDRQFLSTQLVDEARHAIFFDLFFRGALGVEGLDGARSLPLVKEWIAPDGGYGRAFYVNLPQVTEAVRLDPTDYGKWVDGIVFYHLMIEGMLALFGQHQLLDTARTFDILPGLRAGFTAVTRDESRHVNYGVYALSKAIQAGYSDRIVELITKNIDPVCDVISRSPRKILIPDQPTLDFVNTMLPAGTAPPLYQFREEWAFPIRQLRKRLRVAGISDDALDTIEKLWNERIEENLDDYERTYREPHLARLLG